MDYDQAGQFFISLGLNHDSKPHSDPRGVLNVIFSNANYNQDPGGFSLILHYWMKVSKDFRWLRTLPFTFYVLHLLFIGLTIAAVSRNVALAPIAIAVLIGHKEFFFQAFELRGFSMELLALSLSLYLITKDKRFLTNKGFYLFWFTLISILCTARYTSMLTYAALFVTILYRRNYQWHHLGSIQVVISLIFGTVNILVYYFSFRFQMGTLTPLHYLPYLGAGIDPVARITIILVLTAVSLIAIIVYLPKIHNDVLRRLLFFIIVFDYLFIGLSILNIHPWQPMLKRGVSFTTVNIIGIFLLLRGIGLKIVNFQSSKVRLLSLSALVIMVTLLFYVKRSNFFIRQPSNLEWMSFLHSEYNFSEGKLYVDFYSSPEIKYAYEYGALREFKLAHGYPDNFYFEEYGPHQFTSGITASDYYKRVSEMDQLMKYNVMVVPVKMNYSKRDNWKLFDEKNYIFVKRKHSD